MIEPIAFDRLKPIVQRLGLLRLRRINKSVLGREKEFNPGELLLPGEALLLIIASVLGGRNVISEEQLDLIIDEFGKDIVNFGKMLQEAPNIEKLPVAHFLIVDRLYARMSGQKDFLELRTGKKTNQLTLPAIEIVTFDLTALLLRTLNSLKRDS